MYVNGMPILTTMSKNIKYSTTMWVADCNANREFKPVLQVLQDNGWSFTTNLPNAQEHVPEAEHSNCILKEHIHTTYNGIPYKHLPHAIICYMVMETTTKLNYFPSKGGCSNYFSPWEILHHVKLDYKKHCSMPLSAMFSLAMNQSLPIQSMCMY